MHVPSAVRLTVAREIKCLGLKHVTAARHVRSARYLDANLSGTDSEHVRAVRACTSIWEPVRCLSTTGKSRKNEGEGKHSRFPTLDYRAARKMTQTGVSMETISLRKVSRKRSEPPDFSRLSPSSILLSKQEIVLSLSRTKRFLQSRLSPRARRKPRRDLKEKRF